MERICGTYDCLTATGRAIMQDPSLQTMAKSAFVFSKEGEIVSAERQGPSGLRSLFIPTKGSSD